MEEQARIDRKNHNPKRLLLAHFATERLLDVRQGTNSVHHSSPTGQDGQPLFCSVQRLLNSGYHTGNEVRDELILEMKSE